MRAPTLFSYLPDSAARTLCKLAEEAPPKKKPSVLRPILSGVVGMGAGTLAGAGAAHLANEAHKRFIGGDIPGHYLTAAAPILGAGLGLAYNLAQARQIEELRRALESSDDKSKRGVP